MGVDPTPDVNQD